MPPVRKLTVTDPHLKEAAMILIDWDSFPKSLQDQLDRLDTNDDGILTYSPVRGSKGIEVCHGNGTAEQLQRILWGYAWADPFNDREIDRRTLPYRLKTTQKLQDAVYQKIVVPILNGDRGNPNCWRHAGRILAETADDRHLDRLAHGLAKFVTSREERKPRDLEFLGVAEEFLLEAKRFAARVPDSRLDFLKKVDQQLGEINPLLDEIDRQAFDSALLHPYLMASMGSPITADLESLRKGEFFYFGAAVPAEFVRQHPNDFEEAVIRFFNEESPLLLRRSSFQDRPGTRDYPLTAVWVECDQPHSADDQNGSQTSFHIDQERMNRTVFKGREVLYIRVAFGLPQAAEAIGSRPIQKFDLRQGDRSIPGGFVLQNMKGRLSTRSIFASDLHVSERDYEIAAVMVESLEENQRQRRVEGEAPRALPVEGATQAPLIDRFYESTNEQVEAAIDLWNEDYRRGEIDRVCLAGDLADFVNQGLTLEHGSYRSTNIRRLKQILSRLEAPLYTVSGNHDHHGYPFPLSVHRRNFPSAPLLRDLYKDHYDSHRIPFLSVYYWEGIKALLPSSSSNFFGTAGDVLGEILAKEHFASTNDDFLDHYLREIGTYETFGIGLGNKFRVFGWPTESEHFNYVRFLTDEIHEPVGLAVLKSMKQYILDQHVMGKGPRPETFVAFLRELETAKAEGQQLILMGHYPAFFPEQGPEQTPDAVDSLRGDPNWGVRLASWYYRTKEGQSVLAAAIGGHVHHYGEFDFLFHFADADEEKRFRTELGSVLDKKDPATIFDDLHYFRRRWNLENRIEIHRIFEPGSNGYPGPCLRPPTGKPNDECLLRGGTLFLDLPALGIPSEDQSGYLIVTTHPNGQLEIASRLLRVGPQGNKIVAAGEQLEPFRKERWEETRAWDRTRILNPFQPRSKETEIDPVQAGTPEGDPRWDFFPLVYQYPKRKIGLTLDIGWSHDFKNEDAGLLAGGQLLFPLSDNTNGLVGGPNYLALRGEYSTLSDDLNLGLGIDLGVLTPTLTLNSVTGGDPRLGGELILHGLLPLPPAVSIWGDSTFDGDWGMGFNIRFSLPSLTYRYSQTRGR